MKTHFFRASTTTARPQARPSPARFGDDPSAQRQPHETLDVLALAERKSALRHHVPREYYTRYCRQPGRNPSAHQLLGAMHVPQVGCLPRDNLETMHWAA